MKKIVSALAFGITSLVLAGVVLSSCSKSGSTVAPPTLIGGYASSDSVASGNLIAYWPFDGNANDVKGNQTGTTAGGVTFTTGIRGQAYQGTSTGYATTPANANFTTLHSYTMSVWYKLPGQPTTKPEGLFFLTGANTQDELIYEIEPFSPVSGDSVRIHNGFNDLGSPAYQLFVLQAFDTMAINNWVHMVSTYDGASSTYTLYQNGVQVGNQSAFSNGGYITPTQMYTDGSKATPLGNLDFSSDPPTQVIIGTWPAGLFGVSPTLGSAGGFVGQMDELRIYNKALSASEVNGLYLNGKAGR